MREQLTLSVHKVSASDRRRALASIKAATKTRQQQADAWQEEERAATETALRVAIEANHRLRAEQELVRCAELEDEIEKQRQVEAATCEIKADMAGTCAVSVVTGSKPRQDVVAEDRELSVNSKLDLPLTARLLLIPDDRRCARLCQQRIARSLCAHPRLLHWVSGWHTCQLCRRAYIGRPTIIQRVHRPALL